MVDFSLGNWLALNGGTEEVDRWNKLVGEVRALEAERDAYLHGIGEICAAIPLPDVLKATATVGDLIAYLKENLPPVKEPS